MNRKNSILIGVMAAFMILCGGLYILIPINMAILPKNSALNSNNGIKVDNGYVISLFADGLDNPRFMAPTSQGDLIVADPGMGAVLLLRKDEDGDGLADTQIELLTGLNRAHDIALWQGWLYVAETDAISRIRFDAESGAVHGQREIVVAGLPGGGNHWTRTIAFGPDGWLYLSLGSSCNVCIENDTRRAAISRYHPDGSGAQLYATGLRNSVGFDWSPSDGQLYATENGRDWLGDNFPPDELNHIVQGGFYGWPYSNGDDVADPDFGGQLPAGVNPISPVHGFAAHNAPLGMTFLRSENQPSSFQNAALVALHGSWNRSTKDGYKVVSLHWNEDGSITERDFVSGFLQDDAVSGRPAGLVEVEDGSIYLSDDFGGKIYRIRPRTQ